MRHLDAARPRTARELRQFALTVGGAFAALALLMTWRARVPVGIACAVLATLLVVAGLAMPARLEGTYRAWMRLAELMSRVTTPVFMAVVYVAVLTPLALVRRALGRGGLGTPRAAPTGWVRRAPDARRSDMRRQF